MRLAKTIEVEDIIIQHSVRGMNVLKTHLPSRFCQNAAQELLGCNRGSVFILTGFYVNGFAETDGPVGAHFLAQALSMLGFEPVILTDISYKIFFDHAIGIPIQKTEAIKSLKQAVETHHPVSLISVERCGRDEGGLYRNLNGVDISSHTAPLDELFLQKSRSLKIAIGDGGNEIGMGNLKDVLPRSLGIMQNHFDWKALKEVFTKEKKFHIDQLRQHSFELIPSVVPADHVIVSTVSNWGAYGLIAALSNIFGSDLLPEEREVEIYLDRILELGAIDSFTGKSRPLVDGHPLSEDFKILKALRQWMK